MASPNTQISQEQLVALGQRLTHLKGSPGFYDLVNIANTLEQEATTSAIDFEGWDPQQIVMLKARAQAVKEAIAELFRRVDVAINYVPAAGRAVPVFDLLDAPIAGIAGMH